ncbi:MAG: DNA invertase [Beggiatoa sp. IS2]|nr:MAG: DNA invertase [Beggiatoa sp. IS2]
MAYVNTRTACNRLGVHSNTLRNWDRDGKIKTMRTPGGIRLYDLDSLESDRRKFIYARVSSRNQKDDLNSQIEYLKTRFPNHELIEDIGSGLNFKRKGLNTLLELVMSGQVSEIIVTHKDRLCRFGYELIEAIATKNSCKIMVLDESKLSPQAELVNDLLSIIHVFSCRLYGLRKYSRKIKEDTDLPQKQTVG